MWSRILALPASQRVASANFNQKQLPPLSFVKFHGHGKCLDLSACSHAQGNLEVARKSGCAVIYIYMVQRSNPPPPRHGHGSAIVLSPSPSGVMGVWYCPPRPLWCGGGVVIYIYIYMYTYMYVCMDGWMDVWMYGCMDVWMYVCMYVCIYIHICKNIYIYK